MNFFSHTGFYTLIETVVVLGLCSNTCLTKGIANIIRQTYLERSQWDFISGESDIIESDSSYAGLTTHGPRVFGSPRFFFWGRPDVSFSSRCLSGFISSSSASQRWSPLVKRSSAFQWMLFAQSCTFEHCFASPAKKPTEMQNAYNRSLTPLAKDCGLSRGTESSIREPTGFFQDCLPFKIGVRAGGNMHTSPDGKIQLQEVETADKISVPASSTPLAEPVILDFKAYTSMRELRWRVTQLGGILERGNLSKIHLQEVETADKIRVPASNTPLTEPVVTAVKKESTPATLKSTPAAADGGAFKAAADSGASKAAAGNQGPREDGARAVTQDRPMAVPRRSRHLKPSAASITSTATTAINTTSDQRHPPSKPLSDPLSSQPRVMLRITRAQLATTQPMAGAVATSQPIQPTTTTAATVACRPIKTPRRRPRA